MSNEEQKRLLEQAIMKVIQSDHQALERARHAIRDGAPLSAEDVQSPLLRSWERTRRGGLRPRDKVLFNQWLTVSNVRRVLDEHREFIQLVRPDLEQVWESMRSPYRVVLVTDARGTILDSISETSVGAPELEPIGRGRSLVENEVGTTAPAIIACEPEVTLVRPGEHFLDELNYFDCVAAPIFDIQGELAGILNFTSVNVSNDPRCLSRMVAAVRSIEARAYENAAADVLIRIHEDPRYLGTPAQGIMLMREDGVITSANQVAQKILGLPSAVPAQRLTAHDLFDSESVRALFMPSADQQPIAVRNIRGMRMYLSVQLKFRHSATLATRAADNGQHAGDARYTSMLHRADRVFPHGMPILLNGETGTGKEWFARRLHERHRPGQPFVAINCAALAEGIAESELFGHVEGAYTGSRKGGARGLIEQAQGGTLFLDEIGDMPLHLQTRLLRVLQEHKLSRLGGREEIELDVLVLSATHRDLAGLVQSGGFREDLYYRLNGLRVVLPPLREREDLPELIDTLLASSAPSGTAPCRLSPTLRDKLCELPWPGNIRQLQHVLRLATLLAGPGQEITADLMPEEFGLECAREQLPPPPTLEALRKTEIRRCVERHRGNLSAAARELGISRTTLYKHLRA